jgi:hypothetical protein
MALDGRAVSEALPLARPEADAVMLPEPALVGVKLALACPEVGVIGELGLKVPVTPVTEKVTGFVASLTVLPAASWIVATKVTEFLALSVALRGLIAILAGGPMRTSVALTTLGEPWVSGALIVM